MGSLNKRCIGKSDLVIRLGDITRQDTDAIVNAANPGLRGGGGVDGAIHRAAGGVIDRECRAYIAEHGPLPPGKAMWTTGGNLRAKYVIHTVGPIYCSDEESEPILRSAYWESLQVAKHLGIETISFPAISAGVYGYPLDKAARVALTAIADYLRKEDTSLRLVEMVCFTDASYTAFRRALASVQMPDKERDAKSEIAVTVRLFAAPREFLGQNEIELSLPRGAKLADLTEMLSANYPGLGKYLPYSKLAVNHILSAPNTVLHDCDKIALLPPIGGG